MKYTFKNIGILSISLLIASCTFSKKQTSNHHNKEMGHGIELVVR